MNDRFRRRDLDRGQDSAGGDASDAVDDEFWERSEPDLTEPFPLEQASDDITRTDLADAIDEDNTDTWVDPVVELAPEAEVPQEPAVGLGVPSVPSDGSFVSNPSTAPVTPAPGPNGFAAPGAMAPQPNNAPMAFPTPVAAAAPATDTSGAPAWASATPVAAPVSAFPPPVVNPDAAVFVPGQPLIDPGAVAAPAPAPASALAASMPSVIPPKPPLQGHRDLVPTADGVPLGGWASAPVDEEPAKSLDRVWAGCLLVFASTLVAIATFFPWAEAATRGGIRQVTGWENLSGGVSDGPIHAIAGLVGVVCGGLALGGRHGIGVRITAALAGLVSLTTAALRAVSFSTALDQLDGVPINAIATMWGLWLIIGGAFIMTGTAMLLRR